MKFICYQTKTNDQADNPRFIEVLVANSTRFKTLRALTVEGATAEMERLAQDRKDHGTSDSRNGSRGGSFDSNLSPSTTRTPSLGIVTEDDRFAIGDEDDEEEDIGDTARPTSLSEKARGKQPEASARTSANSRNVPTRSLHSLVIPKRDGMSSDFQASQPWLDSWYSKLPLDLIFKTVEDAERKKTLKSNDARAAEFSRESVDSGRNVTAEDTNAGEWLHLSPNPIPD